MTDYVPFTTPTADWLDVTYSPNDNPHDYLMDFLTTHNFQPQPSKDENQVAYRHVCPDTLTPANGVLQISTKYRAYRVSASGDVLATIRALGAYNQYFTVLASAPYRVTRLDAAYDVALDAATVLAKLDAKYPHSVSLSRQRALPTKMLTSRRVDGLRSGTWYAGHRSKARVTARVYDKTLEIFDRTNVLYADHSTRYELTFREGLASLNDAYAPCGIFWAHVSSILAVPPNIPKWEASNVPAWVSESVEVLPYEALLRRVSVSADLNAMLELADRMGPEGRNTFMHMLAKRIGVQTTGQHFSKAS